jgi:cell division protein FtsB
MQRGSTGKTETERKLSPRRPGRPWLGGMVVLIAMIVLADALVGEQSLSSGLRARRQYEAVGADLASLRGENARLRDEVRRLREDPETIEYVARKDLGLARRGEILVVLKELGTEASADTPAEAPR